MNIDKKNILLISVILGLISSLLVWFYLNSIEKKYYQAGIPVNVLIAKNYIPQSTVLTPDIVEIVKVFKEYAQPGSINSLKEILDEKGKPKYITIIPILKNEQITITKLNYINQKAGLAYWIPENKVAVSIPSDELLSFSGLIKPGDRVDIVCSVEYEKENRKSELITFTLLQNVSVLSVNKTTVGDIETGIHQDKKDGQEKLRSSEEINTITVSLTPQEANLLIFMKQKSRIDLVLRNYNDNQIYNTEKIKLDKIISDAYKIHQTKSTEKQIDLLKTLQQIKKQYLPQETN